MPRPTHFISGLPRSGSTLLAAILRQNPRFYAAMSGPVAEMFAALCRSMSGANDVAINVSDATRMRVLHGLFEAYYADLPEMKLVFDTNRSWCAFLPSLATIFPQSRVVCCVRNLAWIIDSTERNAQATNMRPSRMFGHDARGTVYSRAEAMMRPDSGFIGYPLSALRQAWFGEFADRLIAVRYESLVRRPGQVINALYDAIGEAYFPHNFEELEYDEPAFDDLLGLPGFHKVRRRVEIVPRETVVPSDLFLRYQGAFWDDPQQNPRAVLTL